jgi:hypothetical protein
VEAEAAPGGDPRAPITRLAEWLSGDEFIVNVDITDPILTARLVESTEHIVCREYLPDRRRLWFFDGAGRPICNADDTESAGRRVRTRLTRAAT